MSLRSLGVSEFRSLDDRLAGLCSGSIILVLVKKLVFSFSRQNPRSLVSQCKGTHVLPTLQIDLAKTGLFAISLQILTLAHTRTHKHRKNTFGATRRSARAVARLSALHRVTPIQL